MKILNLYLKTQDIHLKILNKTLVFDIYYKPINSFNKLTYNSCYPNHTKNNITLSLAKRIINIKKTVKLTE